MLWRMRIPRWQPCKRNLRKQMQNCMRISLQGCEFKKHQTSQCGVAGTEANEGTTAETTVWYLATVTCRGSSNSSNGLAAVGFLISINVAPMFSLRPDRRDSSNRYSNRHGESLRSEATGRTEVPPFLKPFSAVMAELLRSGFSRAIWRCRCSPCRRDRSSRRRRQWHLLQQHLWLKR